MKTEKIDLREVKVFDLMDQPILLPTTFIRDLGNEIYIQYRDIERQDLGRKIFVSEKEVKDLIMNESELTMLSEIFVTGSNLPGVLHNAILKYMNDKILTLKKEQNGNSTTN